MSLATCADESWWVVDYGSEGGAVGRLGVGAFLCAGEDVLALEAPL